MARPLLAALALCLVAALPSPATAAPEEGGKPPDVVGTDLEGDAVRLGSFAGKAVVVSFWATWCPYCLKELPILRGIQVSAGKNNLQVIAVNTEARDVYRRSAKALSSLDLLMAHDTGKTASEAYGVNGIPHMVIIGRNGLVVGIYRGYDEKSLDSIVADINRALAVAR